MIDCTHEERRPPASKMITMAALLAGVFSLAACGGATADAGSRRDDPKPRRTQPQGRDIGTMQTPKGMLKVILVDGSENGRPGRDITRMVAIRDAEGRMSMAELFIPCPGGVPRVTVRSAIGAASTRDMAPYLEMAAMKAYGGGCAGGVPPADAIHGTSQTAGPLLPGEDPAKTSMDRIRSKMGGQPSVR